MTDCLNCKKELTGKVQKKFCCQSCAAIYNNKKHPKRTRKPRPLCLNCGKEVNAIQSKFCSHSCYYTAVKSKNSIKKEKNKETPKKKKTEIKRREKKKPDNNILRVFGPYKRADGRKHVVKVFNGKKTTQSYPRYLMEKHLGRKLLPEETVDHIDEDYTNDDLSNLRLLSREDNTRRSLWIYDKRHKTKCVYCGMLFIMSRNQRSSRSKKVAGPFCSKTCSGKYGTDIQHNRSEMIFGDRKSEYVKIDVDGKITKK